MDAMTGDFAFLPLGGTGEIGMNFNLYRHGQAWLAIDCGLGFGGPALPEADIVLPDPGFLASRLKNLVGLVITHAHEDHIGAVAALWPQLRCPVHATPFAAAVLRRKLAEVPHGVAVKLHVMAPGGTLSLPPFELQLISMAHSTPEAQAVAIRTPSGLVLHTGDWKLDPEPLIGPRSDEAALAALGDEGVLAMVCDSTNALVEGESGSEAEVRRTLVPLVRGLRGRVAVTCFASNVARVESIALAARAAGRVVAIVGRSLRNLESASRACGYLTSIPPFLSEDAANDVPDERLLLIIAGSQGERRSALARIAADTHPRIALGEGDTVIFSSRDIPGNERAIGLVQDDLVRRSIRVMTADDHRIHVSGHPARDELRRLYRLVRPRYAVPVHGEWRHLAAHAALAREAGATPVLIEDGDILRLAPGRVEVAGSAPVGRLVPDGTRLVPLDGDVMEARRRMLFEGVVVASLAVDESGKLRATPVLSAPGLLDGNERTAAEIAEELADTLAALPAALRREDGALADAARAALRRALGKRLQKRPVVHVHLLRV